MGLGVHISVLISAELAVRDGPFPLLAVIYSRKHIH
jgi:hypothetical protein